MTYKNLLLLFFGMLISSCSTNKNVVKENHEKLHITTLQKENKLDYTNQNMPRNKVKGSKGFLPCGSTEYSPAKLVIAITTSCFRS